MPVAFACLLAVLMPAGAAAAEPRTVRDLFHGEVLYHHYREDYFTALTRLLVSREQGRIEPGREDTELLRVAIELSYGLHENALKVFQSELDARVDPQSRDRIWLSLARTWLRRGYPERAADALQRISAAAPPAVLAERAALEARLLIGNGDYLEAAGLLDGIEEPPVWAAYARYNRAVTLQRAGRDEASALLLEELGDREAQDRELQELRDRANIALGFSRLAGQRFDAARTAFGRIPADSPLSARARYGIGWIDYRGDRTAEAVAAWSGLTERNVTGSAIREVPLMIAYAQRRLGAEREALAGYRETIPEYRRELAAINELMERIRGDQSFAVRAAAGANDRREGSDVPAVYRSPYLRDVVAEDRFQEAWIAWRQLGFLKRHLEDWAMNMSAFEAMLETRRHAYARHLPAVRERLAELDITALEAEVAGYRARLDAIEHAGDVFGLAGAEQQRLAAEIAEVESKLERHGGIPELESHARRLRILKGVLRWDLGQDFIPRLWESRKGLARLDDALERIKQGRLGLIQAQQDAPARFEGYDGRITDLQQRITALHHRVVDSIDAHQRYLQGLTVAGLERYRHRLERLVARAHYELAGLLDESAASVLNREETEPLETAETADGGDPVTAARAEALQAWRDYIPLAVDDDRRRQALRRSADLQLMVSEAALAGDDGREAGLRTAIRDYRRLIEDYPDYSGRDAVYYQVARAHDNLGETGQALAALTRLVEELPASEYYSEAQFRRGEILFVRRDFAGAELAYRAIIDAGEGSPFLQQARYKHGWALFKQARYEAALDDFVAVLDDNLGADPESGSYASPESLSGARRELTADTLRVIGLSFSNLDGVRSASEYFERRPPIPYEPLIFEGLAELYLEKERYSDAAQAFAAFVGRNPNHPLAAMSWLRVLDIYDEAGFTARAFEARQEFLRAFGPRSGYWQRHDLNEMPEVAARIKQELLAMARRDHARAQQGGTAADYRNAARWYRDYLDAFPEDAEAPRLSFLLAELLFDGGAYREAIERYEQSAYRYPAHPRAAEAGYAALLAHDRHLQQLTDRDAQSNSQEHAWHSALRFAGVFGDDPRVAAVLTKTAERQFAAGLAARANAVALLVLQRDPPAEPELQRSAWTIAGHVRFDRGSFGGAEAAYYSAITLTPADDPAYPQLAERLAASIYQQGRQALDEDQPALAAGHFLRVGAAVPAATIVETAEYDAAAALISARDWQAAIDVLERFRRDFPDSRWRQDVTVKLSTAYLETDQPGRAADEFTSLSRTSSDPDTARESAWLAAELYAQAGRSGQSLEAWQRYLEAFPEPFDPAIEARRRLAAAYRDQGEPDRYRHWLNEIIAADAAAGAARTPFSRETAADAAFALAEPLRQEFQDVKLVIPLDRSLKAKRAVMQRALKAYQKAADYGIAGITTSATYRIGEIYHELSRALLESQRPEGLSDDERVQYDILLEEQAFPFEEEAIELHEVNYRRIVDGIYDSWVKRSLEQLAELLPVRYGKSERKVSIIEALH